MQHFDFDVFGVNLAINDIDANKSYTRYKHWKHLHGQLHSAKILCLRFLTIGQNICGSELSCFIGASRAFRIWTVVSVHVSSWQGCL